MDKPYDFGISPDETYLYARAFRCPYTMQVASAVASDLVGLGKDLDVCGCFIDIRGVENTSSAVDKYAFAYNESRGLQLPRLWKYAFVKDHGNEAPKFIETVMANAGYLLRVFDDEVEAIEWLTQK